jgi:hypothetical protein
LLILTYYLLFEAVAFVGVVRVIVGVVVITFWRFVRRNLFNLSLLWLSILIFLNLHKERV